MNRDWIAAAVLSSLACGTLLAAVPSATRPTTEEAVPRIEQAQFKQAFDAKSVALVDTRGEAAYAAGHIPGAILWNSDPAQLEGQLTQLRSLKKPIVTYCT